jgi:hypothetical protein
MKRILLLLFALIGFANSDAQTSAQLIQGENSILRQPTAVNTTAAVFDLQFDYVLPRGGFAGITWTYANFWVSKWQSCIWT